MSLIDEVEARLGRVEGELREVRHELKKILHILEKQFPNTFPQPKSLNVENIGGKVGHKVLNIKGKS